MADSRRHRNASKLSLFSLLSLGILSAAVITGIPASAQSNVGVYVSYADSFRANATNFPTPWLGSPNTAFEGCQPVSACVYDAGAIRIVNNSPSAVTVDSISVHLDTCTYTGWVPSVLAPGADLIVTQLTSGEGLGCTGPTPSFFDTSDIGPGGSNYAFNCTPDGIIPMVDVTINGTTTSYADSGQILNTGGLDAGTCIGNESIQWTKIGSAPCKGSLLTLAPATQTHPVLSSATVTATFTNSCGQPLSDTSVDFSIASGPNAGTTASGVTDANGQASFTYSSSLVGTDTVGASITNLVGSFNSNTVAVIWTVSFAPGGGAFVISDLKDVSGGSVYWWGAQWWKNDHLSTGLAPASFKGYENGNASPWCGQTWTTRPGNSSRPPKAVAANSDMAVIVSSSISKRGPVISGDILAIVLVHTNPGYGPNPGHKGTGTIVATLCTSSQAHASRAGTSASTSHGLAASPAGATGAPAAVNGPSGSPGGQAQSQGQPAAASPKAQGAAIGLEKAAGNGNALGRR